MESPEGRIKRLHLGNLRTLLKIYWSNKPIYKSEYFVFSVATALIIVLIHLVLSINSKNSIELISNICIEVFPNIIGFNLGGYVLLISLNAKELLVELTEPEDKSEYSFYQKSSSLFAFSILIQISTIITGLIFILVASLSSNILLPELYAKIVNSLALLFLSFIFCYSTVLIIQNVLNIFNYGQIIHFFTRMDEFDNQAQSQAEDK